MKKICRDKEIFKRVLFEQEYECCDEFGSSQDKKRRFKFFFRVSRIFTLGGIVYRVEIPDLVTHDKIMLRAIWRAVKEIQDDGPRYYRLKEELYRKGFMKQL